MIMPGRTYAAAALKAAGCAAGSDLRAVAARLGVRVLTGAWRRRPVCVDGVVIRGGAPSRAADQLDLARGLAAWVAHKNGIRATTEWVETFVAGMIPSRQASGERAAVVARAVGPNCG